MSISVGQDDDKEAAKPRCRRRRCIWVWCMAALALFKVVIGSEPLLYKSNHQEVKTWASTRTVDDDTTKQLLWGSARRHDKNSKTSAKEQKNNNNNNIQEKQSNQESKKDNDALGRDSSKSSSSSGADADPTTATTTIAEQQEGRHHHKHVNVNVHVDIHKKHHHHKRVHVHVIADDDDFTFGPNSTTDNALPSSGHHGQDESQQYNGSNSEAAGGYDWQKCVHSQDTNCWKNLSKDNKTTTTTTRTAAPSLAPITHPVAPMHNHNKGRDDDDDKNMNGKHAVSE